MYKLIYNNQIIDVLEHASYVKFLPKTKKLISVDEKQANGVIGSDGKTVYHLLNTKNTFTEIKKSVEIISIDKEEYDKLTTEIMVNQNLEERVQQLEQMILELQTQLKGR